MDWNFSKVSFFFFCEVIEIEYRHIYCFEVFMISKLTNLYFYSHQMSDILGVHVISSLIALCRGFVMETLLVLDQRVCNIIWNKNELLIFCHN